MAEFYLFSTGISFTHISSSRKLNTCLSSRHLVNRSLLGKYRNYVWNMFKVSNKDTRKMQTRPSCVFIVSSGISIVNFGSVGSIVYLEQVNACWEGTRLMCWMCPIIVKFEHIRKSIVVLLYATSNILDLFACSGRGCSM